MSLSLRLATSLTLCVAFASVCLLHPDSPARGEPALVGPEMVLPSPTPTPTEPPPGDLVMTGHVYEAVIGDAIIGPSRPISGANVSVLFCVPQSFSTSSLIDGSYTLLLPGTYLNACSQVTLQIWADGYVPFSQPVTVADLRAQPQRDFGLRALASLFLPRISR